MFFDVTDGANLRIERSFLRRGFPLRELLVVLVIVSLPGSSLIPAGISTRESSPLTQGLNSPNLIGLADTKAEPEVNRLHASLAGTPDLPSMLAQLPARKTETGKKNLVAFKPRTSAEGPDSFLNAVVTVSGNRSIMSNWFINDLSVGGFRNSPNQQFKKTLQRSESD